MNAEKKQKYQRLREKIKLYFQLMRFHKPIGILLLLWPTWWALWIAAHGFPNMKNFFIFTLGVVVMRAAGCVINDIADRKLDLHVSRTKNRPLTSGAITLFESLIIFFILCTLAFILVLLTNSLTIKIAFFAVFFVVIYPFTKRYTHWPQLFLSIAFSFSIPMAFAAEKNTFSFSAGLLMFTNIFWTIAYDTQYAMIDREDDVKIGIKSTAILFGKYDRLMIAVFQAVMMIILCVLGLIERFGFFYFVSLFMALLLFIYQQKLLRPRSRLASNIYLENCFRAFMNNQWVGLVIWIGIAAPALALGF